MTALGQDGLAALGVVAGLTIAAYAWLSWNNGGIYFNFWITRRERPTAFRAVVVGCVLAGVIIASVSAAHLALSG